MSRKSKPLKDLATLGRYLRKLPWRFLAYQEIWPVEVRSLEYQVDRQLRSFDNAR